MDENVIKHLDASSYDVCMFNNYFNLYVDKEEFENYSNIFVVAWSLGVWAAIQVFCELKINISKSIALNGTGNPVNDETGIPRKIFQKTLDGWNETARIKFNMRMMGGLKNFNDYSGYLSKRLIDDQKRELLSISKNIGESIFVNLNWDRAVIGEMDMIFPPKNQLNYWTGKSKIVMREIPHFPFINISSWDEVLNI